jgi:uncharacterized protein YnzC (UPF0291/DUF896 family)
MFARANSSTNFGKERKMTSEEIRKQVVLDEREPAAILAEIRDVLKELLHQIKVTFG